MAATPPPPDPTPQRHRDILDRALTILRATLPPPIENTPEAWEARDRVALGIVGALRPANVAEADLAALHVAFSDHAGDCLRRAAQHAADPQRARTLLALAASMGREARGNLNALTRLQAVRKKREATEAGRANAALAEQTLLALLTAALERMPPGPPARPAVPEADRRGRSRQYDRPQESDLQCGNVVAFQHYPPNTTIH